MVCGGTASAPLYLPITTLEMVQDDRRAAAATAATTSYYIVQDYGYFSTTRGRNDVGVGNSKNVKDLLVFYLISIQS